jgi:hypothetical protein
VLGLVAVGCGDNGDQNSPDAPPDQPGALEVSIAADAQTTEAGGMTTFTVRLSRAPRADVTVPLASNDTTEGAVMPAALTFTSSNWDQPQTVTVVGADDTERDGLVNYTIRLGVSTSDDAAFAGLTGSAALTNVDDDIPGVTVSAVSGTTSEALTTATFTVVLDALPLADVTIPITSSDPSEITASTSALVFTTANWNTPQTVTLTGVDDRVADGDQTVTIDLGTIDSTDAGYAALTLTDVTAINVDDDQANVIATSAMAHTTEAGGTTTFTVVLSSEPTAAVTITPSSADITEGETAPASLVFDASNWDEPQTVTVTGKNDDIDDGDITFDIALGVASGDALYAALTPAPVRVTNDDDDTAAIVVSAISGDTNELGGTATFTVVLASEPVAPVTVNLASSNTDEGTLSAAALVFDASTWDQPQTVTVTGQDDHVFDGDETFQIVFSAPTTTDPVYATILPDPISVTNYEIRDFTFEYTGGPQAFVVPAGITSLTVEAEGAQGGANWVNNTNFGARVTATLDVTPGETLGLYVGGQGSLAGGWNGGGAGDGAGRGGGGASDVRRGGATLADRIVVAGAGGGAGYWSSLHVVGGVGGGGIGGVGGNGYRDPDFDTNPGGKGATQTEGGTDGTCVAFNVTSMAGSLGQGGTPLGFACGCEGYGGGGGYYGGAGSGNCRGGGGGSSYVVSDATDASMIAGGADPGNGQITIRLLPTP